MPHASCCSRRHVIAGTAALLLTGRGAAQASRPRFVDVHHHILPPAYLARKRSAVVAISSGMNQVLEWTPDRSLAEMDRAGVETACTSMSTPGVWFGDRDEARLLTRICNDYAIELGHAHPGRFETFATLPLPDIEGSLAELARLPDVAGFGLMTSYDGRYIGDAAFWPVLAALDARGAIVYVHPTAAPCCVGLVPGVPPAFVEFPFDTTRAIVSLLYSGAVLRYPRIRFVFSHGGGAAPVLLERIAAIGRGRHAFDGALPPGGAAAALRGFWYDTASAANPSGWGALSAVADPARILYGTDYPYGDMSGGRAAVERLGLSPAMLTMVGRDNARALLNPAT